MAMAVVNAGIIRAMDTQQAHPERRTLPTSWVRSLRSSVCWAQTSRPSDLKAVYCRFELCADPVIRFKSRNCCPAKMR